MIEFDPGILLLSKLISRRMFVLTVQTVVFCGIFGDCFIANK